MPISFTSLISLYLTGFDKMNDLPDEILEDLDKSRQIEISNMIEMQFVLSYHAHISKKDSDDMSIFELNNWYEFLKKQKALDAEGIKDKK